MSNPIDAKKLTVAGLDWEIRGHNTYFWEIRGHNTYFYGQISADIWGHNT